MVAQVVVRADQTQAALVDAIHTHVLASHATQAAAVKHRASGIAVLQATDLVGQCRIGIAIDLSLGIGDHIEQCLGDGQVVALVAQVVVILRFLVVSLAFYGMSTFEGPMMAIKTVNALSHYTDWTIGHVHAGALGWVAMITIGSLYHLIPKVYGVEKMHSVGLINAHFWLATIGTVLYIASMWNW